MSLKTPRTLNRSKEKIPRYNEGTFINLQRIGEGGEATVFQGNFRKTRTLAARPSGLVAIKKFNRPISMAATSTEWREIEILKANKEHPRIVQLFGIITDKYDKKKCSGYIMEYMENGSLASVIHNKSVNYDLNQIYSWLQQAASGIMYLHEQNIIHRDIKPDNLLLGNTLDDLKVADFGFARHTSGESSITRGIGTGGYTAPEVFETGRYDNAADVYSFTTTIWEIFHRKKPLDEFKNKVTKNTFELTTKVKEGWHPVIEPSLIEPGMQRLLESGWSKDPLARRTFKEILAVVEVQPIVEVTTILILAGRSNKMHLLNGDRTWWITLELPTFLNQCGAVLLDEEIYIFGGLIFISTVKMTYKLNREMKWIQLADMNEQRIDIHNSSVVFHGCIWVFGGWNHSEGELNSVEKYIPEENKWIQMPFMNEKRARAAAAACKGKLFVSGGDNGDMKLRSMECFDPASQKWTMFLDLPSPTWLHAMISDGICLTVLGGDGWEKSVWKINPNEEEATWKELPEMRESRCQFTANLLGDNIFAIGGYNNGANVEFFNGETWEYGPGLPEEYLSTCSIVIPAHLAAALSSHCHPAMASSPSAWRSSCSRMLTFYCIHTLCPSSQVQYEGE